MGRISLELKGDEKKLTQQEKERIKEVLLSRVASRLSGLLAGRKTLLIAIASIASGLGLQFGGTVESVSPMLEDALKNNPTGLLTTLLGGGLATLRSGMAKAQKETDAKLDAMAKKLGVAE